MGHALRRPIESLHAQHGPTSPILLRKARAECSVFGTAVVEQRTSLWASRLPCAARGLVWYRASTPLLCPLITVLRSVRQVMLGPRSHALVSRNTSGDQGGRRTLWS